jgi:hypothetical protein
LRADEQKALADLVLKYEMNRHAIIKLAIRRFLFPNEKTSIPLDDHAAAVQDGSVTVKPSQDTEDILTKLLKAARQRSEEAEEDPFIFP